MRGKKTGFSTLPLVASYVEVGEAYAVDRAAESRRIYPGTIVRVFPRTVRAGEVYEKVWVVVIRKKAG